MSRRIIGIILSTACALSLTTVAAAQTADAQQAPIGSGQTIAEDLANASPALQSQTTHGPEDPAVRAGILLFGGYGRSRFTSASSGVVDGLTARYQAGGFGTTSTTIDNLSSESGTAGGGLMLKFRGSLLGADVSYRYEQANGPRLESSGDRPSPEPTHDETSSALDFKVSALSLGARVDFGSSFFIAPTVDFNFWHNTTTTSESSVGPGSPVDLTGHSAGYGVRAYGRIFGPIGVGAEYHRIFLTGATPASTIAPWPSKFHVDQFVGVVCVRLGP